MVGMVIECRGRVGKVKRGLEEGLMGESYVRGKGGIKEGEKEYEKVNKNK